MGPHGPGLQLWTAAVEAGDPPSPGIQGKQEAMASVFMCGVEDLLFSGSRFVWNLTVSTLRRWYTERLRACHQVLRTWCGLRDVYQVSRGELRSLQDAQRSWIAGSTCMIFILCLSPSPYLAFSKLLAGCVALGSDADHLGLTVA